METDARILKAALTESQKNVARLETKNNDLLIERDWLSNGYSKIFKELENCKIPIILKDRFIPVTSTGDVEINLSGFGINGTYIRKDIVNKQMTEMMREVANKITENIDKTVEEGKRLINELS